MLYPLTRKNVRSERASVSLHNLELQSLRGIAACVVMTHHALRVPSSEGWAWNIGTYVLNGHAAVVMFFVLSGYVLTQSLLRRGLSVHETITFFLRRAFRIYPAFWVAMALGAMYMYWLRPLSGEGLAAWVVPKFDVEGLTAVSFLRELAGLKPFLVPVGWTISVELISSLALPLIVMTLRSGQLAVILIFLVLFVSSLTAETMLLYVPFYLLQFAIGAALACFPKITSANIPLWLVAMALLSVVSFHGLLAWSSYAFLITLIEGLCSALIIASLVGRSIGWLRSTWLVKIGDWSYSIYLLHLPVAFGIGRLLADSRIAGSDHNLWAVIIAIGTIAITVPLSAATYRFVELPSIAYGSVILNKLSYPSLFRK